MSISSRKKEHIKLVKRSQVPRSCVDKRFNYEPLLSSHPDKLQKYSFLGENIGAPIFISSMTGGSYKSKLINKRLATAAKVFNIPMGLGSIRPYLESVETKSFKMRMFTGNDVQLFGNIGIAQVEQLFLNKQLYKLQNAVDNLELNGLIIHINPLQEWVQKGGDLLLHPPLNTLREILPELNCIKIIKEVGCGFGPESLKRLIELPVNAIDLSGFGGTNFTKIELIRDKKSNNKILSPLINIGHTPEEMIDNLNSIISTKSHFDKEFIISGGIKNFLDGYYYKSKLNANSIYGYANTLLKYATKSEKKLFNFIETDINGYNFSKSFLKIK